MKLYTSVKKWFHELGEARRLLSHLESLGDLSSLDSTEAYYLSYDASDMATKATHQAKLVFFVYIGMNVPLIATGIFKDLLPHPNGMMALVSALYLGSLVAAFWVKLAIADRLSEYFLDLRSASIPPLRVND